jgi:hypothetical protein
MLIGDDLGSHTIYKTRRHHVGHITPPHSTSLLRVAPFRRTVLNLYARSWVVTDRGDSVGIIDELRGDLRHAGMADRVELHHQRVRDALAAVVSARS